MTKKNSQAFVGTESELTSMTEVLNDMHNDLGMPAMWRGVEEMIEANAGSDERRASRRTFLLGAGASALGGAALLGLSSPSFAGASMRTPHATPAPRAFPPAGLKGDLAVAAVAASLENLAVFAYEAGLTAAAAGKLGKVPPAVATFAVTAKAQHTQHASAWNAVLKAHGKAKVATTNPALTPTVKADFAKVTNVTGLANLALMLEIIAAETYQAETSKLMSKEAIGLSASIQPVEMQHVAILYYVLGEYPGAQNAAGLPIAFSSTTKAA